MRLHFFIIMSRPSVRLDPSSNAPSQAGHWKGPAMQGLELQLQLIKMKQACGVKKNRVTRRRFEIIEKM
jgi:hypothetical protein